MEQTTVICMDSFADKALALLQAMALLQTRPNDAVTLNDILGALRIVLNVPKLVIQEMHREDRLGDFKYQDMTREYETRSVYRDGVEQLLWGAITIIFEEHEESKVIEYTTQLMQILRESHVFLNVFVTEEHNFFVVYGNLSMMESPTTLGLFKNKWDHVKYICRSYVPDSAYDSSFVEKCAGVSPKHAGEFDVTINTIAHLFQRKKGENAVDSTNIQTNCFPLPY